MYVIQQVARLIYSWYYYGIIDYFVDQITDSEQLNAYSRL